MVKEKRQIRWKEILESILIGALVAFLSSFFDGIAQALNDYGNNTLGGITTTLTLLSKRLLS